MDEKPRLIVYSIIGGFISGLLYTIVFVIQGLLMDPPDMLGMFTMLGEMMGDMMGVTDPMMLAMIGFGFHMVGSTILLGGLFGVILILLQSFVEVSDIIKVVILGTIWGLVIWMIGPVMMVPVMMGTPSPLESLFDLTNIVGFVGHIIFGAIIGYLSNFLDARGYLK